MRNCQVSYISLSDCFLSLISVLPTHLVLRSDPAQLRHELGGQFRANYVWVHYCQTVTVYYSERYFCLQLYTDQLGLRITFPKWVCKQTNQVSSNVSQGIVQVSLVLYHHFDLLFGKIYTAFNCRKDESSSSGTSLVSKFPVVYETRILLILLIWT